MAKFRKRVKGNKGKRWPKGQSSSSNPSTHKYREAAKSRFFEPILGPSMLTKEAVEQHDASSLNRDGTACEYDAESFGGKTFKTFDTFASDWSACSNQSFSRFVNNFKVDSAMHKDMLAVLAAVTEVIKQNGGNETSTEYFGALMTALEAEGNTDETIAAILNLLSMGIKSVPASVLQTKFSDASSKFIDLLSKFSETDKTTLLRGILGCLSVLLRALDTAMWSNPSTIQVLDVLLSFITFSKPKVRKAAQHGITVIVRASNINQAGLAHIAKYCIKIAESAVVGNITTSLHTFTLLKEIIHAFPKKELKGCCESILKMMTMNNVLITSCGLQVLHGMFIGKPAALPPADAARLLNALYDYQPPVSDSQPTQAWIAVLQQAYLFLAQVDLGLCMANCPKLFTTCGTLFTTNRPEILTAATHTLQGVITDCLGPASRPDVITRFQQDILKIVSTLKGWFSYEYHPACSHVLHLIAAVFKACGDTCANILMPCLKVLVDLRDSEQFTFLNELENAIGVAVRAMGPEIIIKIVPLHIDPKDKKSEFKRSWLLPVLKDNIKGSTLKIFLEHFLPLASHCKTISEQLKSQDEKIRAIGYDLLQTQIWSLLPSFANEPTDIAASFPMIAKALGGVLNSRKDLRNIVLSALRKLVSYSLSSENEEDKAVMTKFAKNYLPILFVIYTTKCNGTDEEGTRLAAYETIKVYLKVAPPELKKELFDRAFVKIENSETDEFVKESILDLLRALLPYQSKEDIEKLYEKTVVKINNSEHKEQKKYYRLLEEICSAKSGELDMFLNEKIHNIRDILTKTLSKTAPSSKGPRLRSILELLKRIDDPITFIDSILPETILCVKDINSKCRVIAFRIIEYISQKFDPQDYLHIVSAGFVGNQTMISCSLLAAAVIIYNARDKLNSEMEQHLFYSVKLLAVCSTREIVSSALSFIKVYIQAYPRHKIGSNLPALIKILSEMTEDCKRFHRRKAKDILAKLCRWFGADEVATHIPPEDELLKVRVRNIAKIEGRKKRQKEAASKASSASAPISTFSAPSRHKSIEEILAESDSDMDVDEEDNNKDRNNKKKKTKVWITEEKEEIVDFTDTSATRKITATKPGTFASELEKKNMKKKKHEFKTAPDGRLIITDDTDDEVDDGAGGKKKKKPIIPGLDDSEDDYEASDDEDAFTSYSGVGVKRTLSTASSIQSGGPPMKYRAGGKGIHRPIPKALSTASSKRSRKSSNAPKIKTGEEYKAKKAGGDMQRKGMPSPYAYLPLRRDALNKRKRMKAMGQLKHILNSAKRGAKVGTKLRKKKQ